VAKVTLKLKITVKYYAMLSNLMGIREDSLDVREPTVKGVIEDMTRKHGQKFLEYLIDSKTGDLRYGLMILVNNKSIHYLNGLNTRLKEGDVVAFIPAVAGG